MIFNDDDDQKWFDDFHDFTACHRFTYLSTQTDFVVHCLIVVS
jgi:hypothetical protein